MTVPNRPTGGRNLRNDRWCVDVAIPAESPVWVPLGFMFDFKNLSTVSDEEVSIFDPVGSNRQYDTGYRESGFEAQCRRRYVQGFKDSGQEMIRNAARNGESLLVRWYENPAHVLSDREAYQMEAVLTFEDGGGAFDGKSAVTTTAKPAGPVVDITHPADEPTPVPVVTSVIPAAALATAGGDMVVIRGGYFEGATGVSIDGTALDDFVVVSPSILTAVTKAHAAGTVDVTITSSAGTSVASVTTKVTFA